MSFSADFPGFQVNKNINLKKKYYWNKHFGGAFVQSGKTIQNSIPKLLSHIDYSEKSKHILKYNFNSVTIDIDAFAWSKPMFPQSHASTLLSPRH